MYFTLPFPRNLRRREKYKWKSKWRRNTYAHHHVSLLSVRTWSMIELKQKRNSETRKWNKFTLFNFTQLLGGCTNLFDSENRNQFSWRLDHIVKGAIRILAVALPHLNSESIDKSQLSGVPLSMKNFKSTEFDISDKTIVSFCADIT